MPLEAVRGRGSISQFAAAAGEVSRELSRVAIGNELHGSMPQLQSGKLRSGALETTKPGRFNFHEYFAPRRVRAILQVRDDAVDNAE